MVQNSANILTHGLASINLHKMSAIASYD